MFDSKPRQTTNTVLNIKEKAIEIVRSRGPLLPVQITRDLGINIMFASALLSELVDNGTIKISHTKIGGSPVYYVAGQEGKLQALRDKLNDKQQRAFDMLKQSKVLRDSEQEPVIRVSLRDIRDFAHPLRVTSGAIQEIFWKWYMTPDSEAEPIVKEKLEEIEKKMQKEKPKNVDNELSQIEDELKKLEEKKRSLMPSANQNIPIEQKVRQEVSSEIKEKETNELMKKEEKTKEPELIKEKLSKQRKSSIKEEIQTEISQSQIQPIQIDESDSFMMKVLEYFKQNNIETTEVKQMRRESDFEGLVKIPTPVGIMNYAFKAKNKKKITDSDLSLLFVHSQMKKMPILLVTTGGMTKKAQELLNKEFKNITIKQI